MPKFRHPVDLSHDPSLESKRDDIKPMRYRAGRNPKYNMRVAGVSRHDENVFRESAKDYHMSLSVFFHFLAEALEDHRLLILPRGYQIEELFGEEVKRLAQAEVERAVLKHVSDVGMGDPYRK